MAAAYGAQTVQHGNQIFVYNHIRTHQVIYSLTRSLNNHSSLAQLPYLGKNSIPASLRKDLWTPLALISFPSPHAGLSAYRKLREFRRLHETTYPLESVTIKTGPRRGHLLPKTSTQRGKVLMNQKANSVADIAAVLLQQEKGPSTEQLERAGRRVRKEGDRRPLAKRGPGRQREAFVPEVGGVEGVRVYWANLLDAEFAATWPAQVVHDGLGVSRYTAAWPKVEGEVETARTETERVKMVEQKQMEVRAAVVEKKIREERGEEV